MHSDGVIGGLNGHESSRLAAFLTMELARFCALFLVRFARSIHWVKICLRNESRAVFTQIHAAVHNRKFVQRKAQAAATRFISVAMGSKR